MEGINTTFISLVLYILQLIFSDLYSNVTLYAFLKFLIIVHLTQKSLVYTV